MLWGDISICTLKFTHSFLEKQPWILLLICESGIIVIRHFLCWNEYLQTLNFIVSAVKIVKVIAIAKKWMPSVWLRLIAPESEYSSAASFTTANLLWQILSVHKSLLADILWMWMEGLAERERKHLTIKGKTKHYRETLNVRVWIRISWKIRLQLWSNKSFSFTGVIFRSQHKTSQECKTILTLCLVFVFVNSCFSFCLSFCLFFGLMKLFLALKLFDTEALTFKMSTGNFYFVRAFDGWKICKLVMWLQ